MKRLLPWILACTCFWLGACASDEDRAPLLTPGEGDDPVSCDALRQVEPEPNDVGAFFQPGGAMPCAAEGQWCPAEWVQGWCEAGVPFAVCRAGQWAMACRALGDGEDAGGGVGGDGGGAGGDA